MTVAIELPIQHQISFSDDIFSPVNTDFEPDIQISKSAEVDKSIEPLPLLEPEMEISEKDMRFLLTSIESFGYDCKNNDNADDFFPLFNTCTTQPASKNELPELDLAGCLSTSEESELENYLSFFEEPDSDCQDNTFSQCLSIRNQSFQHEKSAHDIIPTAVSSSLSCGNSQCFSVPVISEISPYIKPFQEKNWLIRYKQLQQFYKEEGHCCVSNNLPKYQKLANWVKRQRREYKHMKNGKKSAMTNERIDMLESINFTWDSHDVVWKEKLEALKAFHREQGHCNVPYRYKKDKQLGTWVKGQRHQYKLYREGKSSSMNPHRIFLLTNLGFEWVGKSCTSKHL